MRIILLLLVGISISFLSTAQQPLAFKVYDTKLKKEISLQELVGSIDQVQVLFFGEEHNDSIAHVLQDSVYALMLSKYGRVALSMEMFERDVQHVVDEYLQGMITESVFTKDARAWPNYAKDYRRMIERAKIIQMPVLAANPPRRYVNLVSRRGVASLDSLSKQAKQYIAPLPIDTIQPAYFEKFVEIMGGHAQLRNRNIFYAQSVWDAGMSFTIHQFMKKHKKGWKVLHLNGRFHTDYQLGTFEQLKRRNKGLTIANISSFAVERLDQINWESYSQLGDFVIVTKKP